jgi:hypothetical protein
MVDDDDARRASPSLPWTGRAHRTGADPGATTDDRPGARRSTSLASSLLLVAALVLLGGPGALGSAAFATDAISVSVFDGEGRQRDGIELPIMYPTLSVWQTLLVELPPNASAETVSLTVTNLRDYEHGCLRAEIDAGDTTCGPGPGQGELSEQLAVHLAVGTTADPSDVSACGDLSEVVAGDVWLRDLEDVALPASLSSAAPGEGICLAFGLDFADLPENNLAMGDESEFDVEVAVQGPGISDTAVLGVVSEAGVEDPASVAAAPPGDAQVLGVTL